MWIGLAKLRGPELLMTDRSGEMTEEQAVEIADRYMERASSALARAYPDAEIEIIDGNGIDSFRFISDGDDEDDAKLTIGTILENIWQDDYVWGD